VPVEIDTILAEKLYAEFGAIWTVLLHHMRQYRGLFWLSEQAMPVALCP